MQVFHALSDAEAKNMGIKEEAIFDIRTTKLWCEWGGQTEDVGCRFIPLPLMSRGNRQFIVFDADRYMLRFAQDLGERNIK